MARKAHNIHYIYKTTCNVTGKWYVGMHSTSNENDGYMGSGLRLRRSIRKYGVNEHTKEILEYCDSREKLVLREKQIVNSELLKEDLCMNLCLGGEGGHGSKFLTKEQLSKGGVNANKVLRDRFEESPQLKKEWVEKISEGMKKAYTNGTRTIIHDNFKMGTFHTDETKQLMSEIRKGTGSGEANSQYGTCWITKDGLNKKIKKEELPEYLEKTWIRGRK